MRLHHKRKLIKQRKMVAICEKRTRYAALLYKSLMCLCVFVSEKKDLNTQVFTHAFAVTIKTHKTP